MLAAGGRFSSTTGPLYENRTGDGSRPLNGVKEHAYLYIFRPIENKGHDPTLSDPFL